ncbi:ectonucleotide pyrophosphatase/phosphodiesterase family member 7 isoform X2 [Sturnira hondurensis]|uniref:ectonucleotide pyrophosphatase/phosphodiesterase family member 7 isoform X2 n=1 Tax=Sturnira hondurensis TaxID=192404 RepID=UPI0018793B3E|nr:ectonucleotide pyrophosphatase/phosphodiesterase family member 7 isoform X2 [Sturnira hondurensis]
MRPSAVLLAVALAALLAPGAGLPVGRRGPRNKLLLVSFDGFRWDYDQDVETPNLDTMALDGVKARYMTPAFVTMTSPCHFTLVTGKYVENHGVVHNMFYDTATDMKLPYYTTLGLRKWWDNGSIPIWITAQRQGLRTGSFFYPGGNVTYQGTAVTLSRKEGILHDYKNEKEWRANVDTVMRWFTDEGLDLVTLYFGEPDSTGHRYGPDSQQRKDMVMQVDRTVGYLRDSIRRSGLESSLNLIVTSDHGMTTVNKKASDPVELRKITNFTFEDIQFYLLDYGPNGMLLPKEGKLEAVYEALKDAHPKLHVYKKESFPKSFHYANNPRITPLLMYSDPGYVIHGKVNLQSNNGEHGFDNGDISMKTIFRAVGPSFRRGLEVEPFESVHVYELLCKLLDIVPEANDGALSTLLPTLTPEATSTPSPTPQAGTSGVPGTLSTPGTARSTSHVTSAGGRTGPARLPGGCPALTTGMLLATVLLAQAA